MPSTAVLKFIRQNNLKFLSRNAVTVASTKSLTLDATPIFDETEEGYKVGVIPTPNIWPNCSRLAILYNAGSRCELSSKDRGITHLIRRSVGLSTFKNSTVNLVRHFQQMGANVECTTTREHMIYTVDVAPNLVTRAGSLLAEMATRTVFFHWELSSMVNKLMQKDIDLLNRRMLPELAMELLHEAAFGQNPQGSGLGFSLFASPDRIGSYSIDQIEEFYSRYFTPSRCSIALVGVQPDQDGLDQLREVRSNMKGFASQKPAETVGPVHGFCGGESRRDLAAAQCCIANLAWPTPGLGAPQEVAFDVAASLLSGIVGRVAYCSGESQTALADKKHDNGSEATAFHKAYNGHGIWGISVRGPTSQSVEERLATVIPVLRSLKLTQEDLAKAKALRKSDIVMSLESPMALATDMAMQISRDGHTYQTPEARAAAVDKVTLEQLNAVFSTMASSTKAAMSVVGRDAGDILPLSVLLSQ